VDRGEILAIINAAAEAYRGVIPDEGWQEPYMAPDELDRELTTRVRFWGYETDGALVGVMAIQRVRDVDLIRHAYVVPAAQRQRVGGTLLEQLHHHGDRQMLVGTWAATDWAIRFYERHGFEVVSAGRTAALVQTYWSIPVRQIESSVVLASPPLV
jgi:N-acetylglutamate synthase-like GNAT family acetyltransferase